MDALASWCRRWLGAPPAAQLFEAGYLSTVKGLRLADGREVVIKVRPRMSAAGRMRGGAPGAVDGGVSVPRTAGGRAPAGRLCRHRRGTRPGRRRAATGQRAGCLVGGRAGAFGRAGPGSRGGAEPCSVPVLERLGSRRAGAVAHVRRARRRLERLSGTAVAGPRRRSRPRSAARPCRRPGDRPRRLAPREPELARPAPARRARLGQRDLPA